MVESVTVGSCPARSSMVLIMCVCSSSFVSSELLVVSLIELKDVLINANYSKGYQKKIIIKTLLIFKLWVWIVITKVQEGCFLLFTNDNLYKLMDTYISYGRTIL